MTIALGPCSGTNGPAARPAREKVGGGIYVPSDLCGGTMVIVMTGSTQLCCHCHEITERASDGDRVACSVCGRPYCVPRIVRPAAVGPQSAGESSMRPGIRLDG
jgi:hypothetical protein